MRGCTTHISDVRNRVVKSIKFLHFAINTLIYFLKQKNIVIQCQRRLIDIRNVKPYIIHHTSFIICPGVSVATKPLW